MVERCLGHSRRVVVYAPWDQHAEHPIAPGDRLLDNLAVVRGAGNDRDASLELVELAYTLLAAGANHLVAAVKRMPDGVLAELAAGPDTANSRRPSFRGHLEFVASSQSRAVMLAEFSHPLR